MRSFARISCRSSHRPFILLVPPRYALYARSRCVTSWAQANNHPIRLKPRWTDWRQLGLWTFYSATSYFALQYLLGRAIDGLDLDDSEEAQDAVQDDTEDEEEEEEVVDAVVIGLDDEVGSFLPIQTPKQLPRQNYRQSDPEWQEFIKLSQDSDRQTAARLELAEKLVRTAASMKPLRQKLGKDIKWTKSWLDFTYPDEAAPEYIQRGWLVWDDGAMWSRQVIPHAQYVQIRHILWPKALYQAGKACLRIMYDLQAIRIKNALGVDLEPKEKQLQLATKVVTMQLRAKARLDQTQDQLEQASLEVDKRPELEGQLPKQGAEKMGPPESKEGQRSDGALGKFWEVKEVPVIAVPASTDFLIASRMFVGTLVQSWKQSQLDTMPPGCCYLTGDVELVGSQARCKMGVQAAYDPKANSFIWINSKPKGFWSHQQAAKGGT